MPIKLSTAEQVFNNRLISPVDAKTIDIDRMLVNLFMLIKYNGQRPKAHRARKEVNIELLYDRLVSDAHAQHGLDAYPNIAKEWLRSDLVDMVYRGLSKEAVASLRPLHLDVYKLRNIKQTRDYNAADLAYSLLYFGDPETIDMLRQYFGADLGRGIRPANHVESDTTATAAGGLTSTIDLDTLAVKIMLSGSDLEDSPSGDQRVRADGPLSMVAARLLADDVRRLMAYAAVIPRHVMLEYLKTLLGLHLGLYMLRLLYLLPGWVQARRVGGLCPHCLGPHPDDFMAPCLYKPLLLVDMGDDFRSAMSGLSQANVASHFARIPDYIKATFTVNQLLAFLRDDRGRAAETTVADALATYNEPPAMFEPTFFIRLRDLFRSLDEQKESVNQPVLSSQKAAREQAQWAEIDAIRDMKLSNFETFVEIVSYVRTPFHRRYNVQLLDSFLQKNSDAGLLRQGRARANARRFYLGSRLLEVLIQLAVLEDDSEMGSAAYRPRPMLVSELAEWLLARYGLVINGLDAQEWAARGELPVPAWVRHPGVHELEAYRDNLSALKERLREIGFYTDLSDAYNAQTLRPRYSLETTKI